MSKLITTRYEYVVYDDAQGVLNPANNTPPTYPPVLDQYVINTVASAGNSYGVFNISGTGTQTIAAPPGANLTVIAGSGNTTNIAISTPSPVIVLPGSVATATPVFTIMPGQTVSFPGVYILAGNLPFLQAVDTTNAALSTTSFAAQVFWSL